MSFKDGSFSFVIHTTPIGRIVQKYYQRCHITVLLLAKHEQRAFLHIIQTKSVPTKVRDISHPEMANQRWVMFMKEVIIPVCFIKKTKMSILKEAHKTYYVPGRFLRYAHFRN